MDDMAISASNTPFTSGLRIHDQVLTDPLAYRQAMLTCRYGDIETSPGVVFHGMAIPHDPTLLIWLADHYPGLKPTLTILRQAPLGQVEPNFIHTDRDMGEWTGILYLHPAPPPGDGTTFWRERSTGAIESRSQTPAEFVDEWLAWRDRELWEPWWTVEARFNRLVVFPAGYFHSRALEANYGDGDEARLIQLVFGQGSLA